LAAESNDSKGVILKVSKAVRQPLDGLRFVVETSTASIAQSESKFPKHITPALVSGSSIGATSEKPEKKEEAKQEKDHIQSSEH